MQSAWALSQVTASVDKNPVMLNESLVLTVVADDDVSTKAFDSSALHKNFIVGRTSVSSQSSNINGKSSHSTTWTTLLMPRSAGKFVIPAFTIGKLRSKPINIDVVETPASAQQAQNIFITSELSRSEVYVQELTTLTVKLHFAIELKRGSLSEPVLEDANIQQIGEDKEGSEIIKGRRYTTIERNYAITPQRSGEFTLGSPIFQGQVLAQSQRRSSFLSFAETKPVSVKGDDIQITVKAIPNGYQGDWLPSELLTLHEEWQPEVSEFKVGEPITRIITLMAVDLSEAQLPELNMQVPKGLKVYPDQAETHSRVNKQRLVSQKVQNFALVASKPGTYQLPEVRIPWWNTVTNQAQIAVIPAQSIKVAPNEEWQENAITPPNTQADINNQTEPNSAPQIISEPQTPWLQWLFLILWLTTSLAWYISSKKRKPLVIKEDRTAITFDEKALLTACKANQGALVLSLLLPWIKQQTGFEKLKTLDEALNTLGIDEFTQAVQELQASCYGKSPTDWDGKALLATLKSVKQVSIAQSAPNFSLNP